MPWTSTRSNHWEVFLEINFNQKTLKFYTSLLVFIERTSSDRLQESMLCCGTSMNINILLTYFLKTSLTHFMAMVFYYTSWNTLETQEVSSWFQRALKETSAMKWVNSHLTFIYLFCLLLFLLFILFFIIFNTFIGFSVQFEACMFIVFGFVFGSLIVVYASRVYLSEVTVNVYLCFLGNQWLFCNWINICVAFYFVNNVVVYKTVLV